MIEMFGPAARIEHEIATDCRPQPPIFFRSQANFAYRVGRAWHIFDMHDAAAANQRGPDRAWRQVPPGRGVEVDALFTCPEGDETRIRVDRGEVANGEHARPIESLRPDRHDDVDV